MSSNNASTLNGSGSRNGGVPIAGSTSASTNGGRGNYGYASGNTFASPRRAGSVISSTTTNTDSARSFAKPPKGGRRFTHYPDAVAREAQWEAQSNAGSSLGVADGPAGVSVASDDEDSD